MAKRILLYAVVVVAVSACLLCGGLSAVRLHPTLRERTRRLFLAKEQLLESQGMALLTENEVLAIMGPPDKVTESRRTSHTERELSALLAAPGKMNEWRRMTLLAESPVPVPPAPLGFYYVEGKTWKSFEWKDDGTFVNATLRSLHLVREGDPTPQSLEEKPNFLLIIPKQQEKEWCVVLDWQPSKLMARLRLYAESLLAPDSSRREYRSFPTP